MAENAKIAALRAASSAAQQGPSGPQALSYSWMTRPGAELVIPNRSVPVAAPGGPKSRQPPVPPPAGPPGGGRPPVTLPPGTIPGKTFPPPGGQPPYGGQPPNSDPVGGDPSDPVSPRDGGGFNPRFVPVEPFEPLDPGVLPDDGGRLPPDLGGDPVYGILPGDAGGVFGVTFDAPQQAMPGPAPVESPAISDTQFATPAVPDWYMNMIAPAEVAQVDRAAVEPEQVMIDPTMLQMLEVPEEVMPPRRRRVGRFEPFEP